MRRKLPLSLRILLGLGLGVLAGLALQDAPADVRHAVAVVGVAAPGAHIQLDPVRAVLAQGIA